jgi:chemotaxis protein MotB
VSDESQRPVVIKRRKIIQSGARGGAWKIAYADFVTAMMAFFLLMWLLGSTTKGEREGIADYFKNPLRLSMAGGSGAGEASSVINRGGRDLTRRAGEIIRGDIRDRKRPLDLRAAQSELDKTEMARLEDLKGKLDAVIDANPALQAYRRQLLIDITSEGLRVQIVDEKNRPMFELGRARLLPHTRDILHEIGKVLNDVPNRISLAGHTDATPYYGGERGYSNWELSTERANASRRELIAGGMRKDKVMRVIGLSSAVLFDRADPFNPINRRISVIVMKKRTEDNVSNDGTQVDAGDADVPAADAPTPQAPASPPVAPDARSKP